MNKNKNKNKTDEIAEASAALAEAKSAVADILLEVWDDDVRRAIQGVQDDGYDIANQIDAVLGGWQRASEAFLKACHEARCGHPFGACLLGHDGDCQRGER